MNNLGLTTTYEEGDKGQFELFKYGKGARGNSFMKAGHGVFFDLRDVELKLSGIRSFEVIHKERTRNWLVTV